MRDKKLAIGLPLGFPMVHADFFKSYILVDKGEHMLLTSEAGPITALRNGLMYNAIHSGANQLMMMDVDMVYPVDTVNRLTATMNASGAAVVAGLMFRRYPPFDPCFQSTNMKCKVGDILPVDRVSTACMLIDVDWVKEHMFHPWFETEDDELCRPVLGEDYLFCDKVREAGGEILLDASVIPKHLTTVQVDEKFSGMWATIKKEIQDG